MNTTLTLTPDTLSTYADQPLSALVGTLPAPASVEQPSVVRQHPHMTEQQREFCLQYHLELRRLRVMYERKLTQAERINCYMLLREQRGEIEKSKRLIVIGELAMYHSWPLNKVVLAEKCSKYTYNYGLIKDRTYREIDPLIQEWLND